MKAKRKLRILIAYNDPADAGTQNLDYISEVAVKNEADTVYDTLLLMGHHPALMPVHSVEECVSETREFAPDLVFNLCEGFHGFSGHEMHAAGLWEMLEISYTGNRPLCLGLSQDKILAKQIFKAARIPTPPYEIFKEPPRSLKLDFPVIAKPSREDASLGISRDSMAHDFGSLAKIVDSLLERYNQPVLVEKFISGREFNVSILGNTPPRVLPISEVDFSPLDEGLPRIACYESKWLSDHPYYRQTPTICPAKIGGGLRKKLERVALEVFAALGASDYGRVDFRADARGNIFVLEFNPNPDISPEAGFAKAIAAAGMKYSDFVETLIRENLN